MSRVFAITGASGALGSAVAKAAAGQGGGLAFIDFSRPAPAEPEGADVFVQGGVDLSDANAAGAAIDAAADRFGGLDALINIAGGFSWEKHEGGDWQTWHRLVLLKVE